MTKLEIQNAIETDPLSLVNFVGNNNPADLIISENVAGYKSVSTVDQAKDVLLALIQQGKKDEFLTILKGVPYINDVPNETAGFKEYFLTNMAPEDRIKYQADINSRAESALAAGYGSAGIAAAEPDTKSTWLNIGSGIVGIVGSIFGAKAAVSNATYLDAQARATQAQTIKIVVLVAVALLVLAGVVFAFRQAKK